MTELISLSQANHLMLFILVAAPVIGLLWGLATKQLVRGTIYGVAIGAGNYLLWNVYNVITDHLGLDTVKNLVVNLVLFTFLGVVAGIVLRRANGRNAKNKN